jgi:hypothetical protein
MKGFFKAVFLVMAALAATSEAQRGGGGAARAASGGGGGSDFCTIRGSKVPYAAALAGEKAPSDICGCGLPSDQSLVEVAAAVKGFGHKDWVTGKVALKKQPAVAALAAAGCNITPNKKGEFNAQAVIKALKTKGSGCPAPTQAVGTKVGKNFGNAMCAYQIIASNKKPSALFQAAAGKDGGNFDAATLAASSI